MPTFRLPTQKEKRLIYEIYLLLCRSHFSLAKKRALMTAALGYETWSWRVTGITKNAVLAIADPRNNYRKPTKVLSRDHGKPRSETYNEEFFAVEKSLQAWWDWVWENDKTTLMTNEEHRNPSLRSKIYPLDPTKSYFVCAQVAGWHHTIEHEGAMIRQLIKDKRIRIPS